MKIALKPGSVQIRYTQKCNLRCLHCDIWKQPARGAELSLEQWKSAVSKVVSWLGPVRIDISGGEPFIREDLADFIKWTSGISLPVVVCTNATLIEKSEIDMMFACSNLVLNVSVDGESAGVHDRLKGVDGAYDKLIDTLVRFNKPGRKCGIMLATILMGYNARDIMNIAGLAFKHRLADGIHFQILDRNFGSRGDPDWRNKNSLWPAGSDAEYSSELIGELIRLKKIGAAINNPVEQLEFFRKYVRDPGYCERVECRAAEKNLIIDSDGSVLLCWNMAPAGNILSGSPKQIWESDAACRIRSSAVNCKMSCRALNCNF